MSPAPIIVAGHVCLDLIPTLTHARLPDPGGLQRIGPAEAFTGGAVANTGLALHRLGVPVRLVGKVGDDTFGRIVLDHFRREGPALADDMIVSPGGATSYSIVINPPGVDRSFLHCPGANDTFCSADVPSDILNGAKLIHFGYPPLMARVQADGGHELVDLFMRARDAGLGTSLDTCQFDPQSDAGRVDWVTYLRRVLPAVDLFFPSVDELLLMTDPGSHAAVATGGLTVNGPLLHALSRTMLDWGAGVVVIKLGDRGLYVRTADDPDRMKLLCERLRLSPGAWTGRRIYASCFRVNVAGTTGAGDCTIAGFLRAVHNGESPGHAMTSAVAAGAAGVEARDATSGIPDWERLQARIDAGWPRSAKTIVGLAPDVSLARD